MEGGIEGLLTEGLILKIERQADEVSWLGFETQKMDNDTSNTDKDLSNYFN